MARMRVVTREVSVHQIFVKALENDEALVSLNFIITGEKPALDRALKIARQRLDSNTLSVIKVTGIKSTNVLMGMTEEDFIAKAVILDEERKPVNGSWYK